MYFLFLNMKVSTDDDAKKKKKKPELYSTSAIMVRKKN